MIQTSHIGSLPFLDIDLADKFNNQFDLPVLYSLPLFDDSDFMLAQVLGTCTPDKFSAQLIEKDIKIKNISSIQKYKQFKFQMVGPITLIKSFSQISNDEIDILLKWYKKQLLSILDLELMSKCYFFLDEPMLFMATDVEYKILNSFLLNLKSSFYKLGVHCCSKFNLSSIDLSLLNGLSFESKYFEYDMFPANLDLFLGVVDTKSLKLDDSLELEAVKNSLYVTPHCGLALTDSDKMDMVSRKLSEWIKMTSL